MMLTKLIPVKYRYTLSLWKSRLFGYKKYAQYGEDRAVLSIFADKLDGFYVDVGAHHPERYSNTHLLFKRGWSGINVDPDPHAITLFKKMRPHDRNVQCGVGSLEGTMTYYQFSDPALNTFVKAEADKWMRKDWVQFLGTRSVPVQKLSTILAEAEPHSPIDLLTIDAEGLSLDVLSSLAWSTSAHYPHVIVIEGDAESFLEAKGYKLYQICGLSKVFVRKE